jgi:cell division protein FtsN
MNSHHRGVYQPLVENVAVYDLSEESEDEERSRVPLLIVIGLIVLSAFIGVIWIAYNQGLARGRASVVLVPAPQGPVRTVPDAAQGAATPFTGLKIYNDPVPPEEEALATTLAPQAEPDLRSRLDTAPAPQTAPPPQQATQAVSAPPAARLRAPVPAAPAPAPSPEKAAQVPAAPAEADGLMLQIGAYPSMELAEGAYANFKTQLGAIAGSVVEDVQKADLGAKGIWYRLRVGPYADKAAAVTTCQKLKAQGGTCFVATP